MKKGDYHISGKYKTVISRTGEKYVIGPKLGKGGVGKVYKTKRLSDGKNFAFKEYVRNEKNKGIHLNILQNIENLIRNPIKGEDGNILNSVVLPLEIVDLNASESFGYIMERVDLKNYLTLKKVWSNKYPYPDAKALCKICENIALFFQRLHVGTGVCYKDVNEGNIYFNPKTGDIKVIDNDNIGIPKNFTIKGTPGYIAPEIYMGLRPDNRSDQFSLAVFLYRLLVGGYPLEGKKTVNYVKTHEVFEGEAGRELYGENALFAFDPIDSSNEIRSLKDSPYPYQTKCWDELPNELKECFINTFSTCLQKNKRANRTTDKKWFNVFQELEKSLKRCSKCNKNSFYNATVCRHCGQKFGNERKSANNLTEPQNADFRIKIKAVDGTIKNDRIKIRRSEIIRGKQIWIQLNDFPLMKLKYNPGMKKLALENLSSEKWLIIQKDGTRGECKNNERVVLDIGVTITIIPNKLQMTLLSIH